MPLGIDMMGGAVEGSIRITIASRLPALSETSSVEADNGAITRRKRDSVHFVSDLCKT